MKNAIAELARQDPRMIIGLMSGTSADGVDAALMEVRGSGPDTAWELIAFSSTPFEPPLRDEILSLQLPAAPRVLERLARLHYRLGDVYADACAGVTKTAGYSCQEVDLIGLHGQTVFHDTTDTEGATPATLQLGEAAVLAERTGCPVISNFRAGDVAAGGTGAPLVPYVDYLLFRSGEAARLCLNLGGIANFTALPRTGGPDDLIAFDTGPGNMLIDALVAHYTKGKELFDRAGARAGQAPPHAELLAELMAHDFIGRTPPKSAGREQFGAELAERVIVRAAQLRMSPAAAISTATSFTARSIAEAYRLHVLPRFAMDEVLVAGGGVHNVTLMMRLAQEMEPVPIRSTAEHGLDPDAKEAVAFALLANESLHGRPGNITRVTGARRPVVLGAFVPGRRT